MEKLSMCRICVSDDIPLRPIVDKYLHEMYEVLTKMPFVTEGNRPIVTCDPCCASLKDCYELRRRCLSSEKRFTQLLTSNVVSKQQQLDLQILPEIILEIEEMIPIEYINVEVKQEAGEDDVAVEQDDADLYHSSLGLHTECDIPLDIVKEEPVDDDTGAPGSKNPRLTTQMNYEAMPANNLTRSDQTKDYIEEPKTETKRAVEDKSVQKNNIVETRDKIDIRLRNNKQNYSISDHNYALKEMSENKISADQSVNRSSSNKLEQLLCDTCPKRFRYKANLIKHMRTHIMVEKPNQCNVCKKCFTQKGSLKVHARTHTGEQPYECNVCKKCFRHKSSFNIHIRTHTGEKPPYHCKICQKYFSTKRHLESHTRTHTGEKPYQCNICKKCFSQKSRLRNHTRIHTGEKPYVCNVCKKCFSLKVTLAVHTRTHTGENPYECNVCKKCFRHKISLNIHMREHTGEKHPHDCKICQKHFSTKSCLDVHTLTHTGEKPYQCNICKKCFTRKSRLHNHTRTHTGEKPYECNVCKKCFNRTDLLARHMRTHNIHWQKTM